MRSQWPAFLLAFVFPLLGVYWWWGGFASATVMQTESATQVFAALEHTGDLGKLPKTQEKLFAQLRAAGITPGDTLTLVLTDPRTVAKPEQRAWTGYRVSEATVLPQGVQRQVIPQREVIRAQVRAGVMLAPGKAYAALDAYLRERGHALQMPALETYRPSGTPSEVGEFFVEVARP